MNVKRFFILLFLLFSGVPEQTIIGQSASKSPVSFDGLFIANSNGFGPIPAFSFDKPTAMMFLSVQKGRFSYSPDIAIGLDGDLWMTNHWLHYHLPGTDRFHFRTGINPNIFFDHQVSGTQEEIIHAYRYVTFEASGSFTVSQTWDLNLMYRYNRGLDEGTISGHFMDLSSNITLSGSNRSVSFKLAPQLFYFDHTGNLDGIFGGFLASAGYRQNPFSVYFHGVRKIWAAFSPAPVFQWSAGLQYRFSL